MPLQAFIYKAFRASKKVAPEFKRISLIYSWLYRTQSHLYCPFL